MSNNEKESVEDVTKNIITAEDLMIVAQKVTGDKTIEVLDYHVSDYSTHKLGLLGMHHQLKITVQVYDAFSFIDLTKLQ